MARLEIYQKYYRVRDSWELVRLFRQTLIATNRTPSFFVDWRKVKKNVDEIRIELSLWTGLIGSRNIEADFEDLVKNYPEVVKTIPILFAIREREFPVIVDFYDPEKSVKTLDFNKKKYSKLNPSEIRDYLEFTKEGGIFDLFHHIRSFYDYVLGVEVGLDTNARKNRSGDAMEDLLSPLLHNIADELQCKVIFQKKFGSVQALGGKIPIELANRKSDFILYSNRSFVNIEVNYFSGAGSKPEEIVDSYINRQNELKKSGWSFIWITDGDVWRVAENQITKAFNGMDYVMNIEFARKGILKEALRQIFSKQR